MKNIKYPVAILASYALLVFFMAIGHAQEAGESITKQGAISDDLYLAGGNVHVLADVTGDVVAAGGRISIKQKVNGDVMAAGGRVLLMADVLDDARLAGGDVTLAAHVGDDAIIAGGSVTSTPDSLVEGRAWLTGGYLDIAGHIKQELKAAGGRIILNAKVDGDVELSGESIEILSAAVIKGDLIYRSANKAKINAAAKITGTIKHVPYEYTGFDFSIGKFISAGILILLGIIIAAVLTGVVLYIILPDVFHSGSELARQEPLKYLGLGFLVLVVPPVIMGLLMLTLVGLPLAAILFFIYGLFLCVGVFAGIFYAGDSIINWIKKGADISRRQHIIYFSIAILLFLILSLIPFIGNLITLLLLLIGMGVLFKTIFNIFKEHRMASY